MTEYFVLFYKRLPRRKFDKIGVLNPIGEFFCSVNPYDKDDWRTIKRGYDGFTVRYTKSPYGFLYTEEDFMALKLADWCEKPPRAVLKIGGKKLKWFAHNANPQFFRWVYGFVPSLELRLFIQQHLMSI